MGVSADGNEPRGDSDRTDAPPDPPTFRLTRALGLAAQSSAASNESLVRMTDTLQLGESIIFKLFKAIFSNQYHMILIGQNSQYSDEDS